MVNAASMQRTSDGGSVGMTEMCEECFDRIGPIKLYHEGIRDPSYHNNSWGDMENAIRELEDIQDIRIEYE